MTVTIEQVRIELADNSEGLYILSDNEVAYFIEKNNNNLTRTCLDCARTILFKLSIRSDDSTVDIFSIKGSKAAAAYMEALKLYLKDPNLNPALQLAGAYAGGIRKSDMEANVTVSDNNAVRTPLDGYDSITTLTF